MVLPLIGAVLGIAAKRKERDRAYHEQDPSTIRSKYEAAGFNPLLGVGNPVQPVVTGIGDTISSGFSDFAAGLQRDRELELKAQEIAAENKRLEKIAADAVLTPKVPNVYSSGRSALSPMNRGTNAQDTSDTWMRPSSTSSDGHGLTGYSADLGSIGQSVDPRREHKFHPNQSISGVIEINNDVLNDAGIGPVPVLGSDGEPWSFGELIGVGLSGGGAIAHRGYKNLQSSLADKVGQYRFKKMYQNVADEKAKKAMRPRVSPTLQQLDAWRMRQGILGN